MQFRTAKLLPWLSSLTAIFLLTGCGACPAPVVIISSPEIIYPDTNSTEAMTISARKQDGNIILTEREFSKITNKLIENKYEIITLKSIIDTANSWDPGVSRSETPSSFLSTD
jgi:uncharacterized lipoprotein YajG